MRTKTKRKNSKRAGSRALVTKNHFRKSSALTNPKRRRRGGRRRNPGMFRGFRNPLSRFTKLGGVSVVDIGIAGVTAIVVNSVSVLLPGAPDSWMRILSQAGVVAALVYVAPNSIKTPVAFGGAAVPAVNAINKLTNNAIANAITGFGAKLIPAQASSNGNNADAGMGAFPRRPQAIHVA